LVLIITYPLCAQSITPEPAAIHGMVLFGKQKMYASHLPMYHSPHDYQVIFELSMDNVSASLLEEDQQKHPNDVTYTLEPEPFVLSDMINHPSAFKAKLFRGHFERGGYEITDNVIVNIEKVVYVQKLEDFSPSSVFPPAKSTSYILFGNEKEQFAAHKISSQPSFDHIIQVNFKKDMTYNWIGVVDETKDSVPDIGGNTLQVRVSDRGAKASITWLKQIYLEFTDLKINSIDIA
jgi:hypothetical protein